MTEYFSNLVCRPVVVARRGDYDPRSTVPSKAFKAEPLAVAKRARVTELAAAALANAVDHMRRNVRGARARRDPDFVHQLRVGARRARVVLRLFRKRIGEDRANALGRDLRWVFQVLGELRDRELLLADVVEPLSKEERDPALSLLATELVRERKRAAHDVKDALGGKRFERLLSNLDTLRRELQQEKAAGKRARKWGKKRLDKRLEAVLSRRDAALGPDESARHELRKELKKLRYAAELMRSLWSKKKVKHYLDRMEALQDALGALNDVATGRKLLPLAAASAPADTSSAVELCERELMARLAERAPALAPAFADFEQAAPFWRPASKS